MCGEKWRRGVSTKLMRAKPDIFPRFAREAFEAGRSMRWIARALALPLGTVKTWRSRGGWKRAAHETPVAVGKPDDHETHRGLKACHMPGRKDSKQLTFSMFRRGMWPPKEWKVPAGLVGGELLMMLQERSCLGLAGKGKKVK